MPVVYLQTQSILLGEFYFSHTVQSLSLFLQPVQLHFWRKRHLVTMLHLLLAMKSFTEKGGGKHGGQKEQERRKNHEES